MKGTLDFKKRASERLFFIRGFSIFLVVVGHVIGARDAGIRELYREDISVLAHLRDFICTFHMPIFFLLSGFSSVFFSQSNHSSLKFIKSKFLRLLIPLLCWAPFYYLLLSATNKINFKPLGIFEFAIDSNFIFWFFPTIIFSSTLGFFFLNLFRSWPLYLITSFSLFVLSFYLSGAIAAWYYFNIFYFLGSVIGSYHLKHEDTYLSRSQIISITSIILCMMLVIYVLMNTGQLSYLSTKFMNGLLGFCALYFASKYFVDLSFSDYPQSFLTNIKSICVYLGKISMSIYLLHILFSVAVRTILLKLNILDLSVQLTLGLLIAVVGPILVHKVLYKNRLYLYSIGEVK